MPTAGTVGTRAPCPAAPSPCHGAGGEGCWGTSDPPSCPPMGAVLVCSSPHVLQQGPSRCPRSVRCPHREGATPARLGAAAEPSLLSLVDGEHREVPEGAHGRAHGYRARRMGR